MSTYIYLECLDHDPPLRAQGESGQHLYDLAALREDIANREALVTAVDRGAVSWGSHFKLNTMDFLAAHRKCRLGIVDEYGRGYPLEAEEREEDG